MVKAKNMSNLSKTSQRTKQIALTITFAAIYVVLRLTPFSMLIGPTGAYLSISDFLPLIYGIILGPYFGGLSVIIGNFTAIGMGRHVMFLGLDFLPDLVAVVSIGFLFRRKWLPVVLLNAALLAAFFADPLTSFFVPIPATTIMVPFAWMHIAAFVVLLTPLARKAPQWITSVKQIRDVEKVESTEQTNRLAKIVRKMVNAIKRTKYLTVGLIIFAFIGTMMQHLTGNLLYEFVYGQMGNPPIIPAELWPTNWSLIVLVYPVERSILIAAAVLVGTPLIYAIVKNNLVNIGKPPSPDNNSSKLDVKAKDSKPT
jgi:hypothetical protein